jgi:hypothetical protein
MTPTEVGARMREHLLVASVQTSAYGMVQTVAADGEGTVRKPRTPELLERHRAIISAQNSVRRALHDLSMPYGRRDGRLLPKSLLQPAVTALGKAQEGYAAALAALRTIDPEVAGHYSVQAVFDPVPHPASFEGGALVPHTIERLGAKLVARLHGMLEAAYQDTLARVGEVVDDVHGMLTGPHPRVRDTTVERLNRLAPMVRAFNVTEDQRLGALVFLLAKFEGLEPEAARENRAQLAADLAMVHDYLRSVT